MSFIDLNDDRKYTVVDLKEEWSALRTEEPENHCENFRTELFEILMATVNGRNDLEISGMTHKEISNYIVSLQKIIA